MLITAKSDALVRAWAVAALIIVCLIMALRFNVISAPTSLPKVRTAAFGQQAAAATNSSTDYEHLRETFLQLVEDAVTGSLYDELGACQGGRMCEPATAIPFDAKLREGGDDWPLVGHTMVGHRRLKNVKALLSDVLANNVPGDFVELGVWRGGLCMYAKAVLDTHRPAQQRTVHLFDAFQRLAGYGAAEAYLHVDEAAVRHNFEKYQLLDDRVKIVKGLFKDSVPKFAADNPDAKIAVLRLDSNFYDSHQDSFYYLYEKVPVGGYIIMDDVRTHPAVQAAWADFQRDHGFEEQLLPVDNNGAYFKKTKDVRVDMSKMKPPRDANKPGQ